MSGGEQLSSPELLELSSSYVCIHLLSLTDLPPAQADMSTAECCICLRYPAGRMQKWCVPTPAGDPFRPHHQLDLGAWSGSGLASLGLSDLALFIFLQHKIHAFRQPSSKCLAVKTNQQVIRSYAEERTIETSLTLTINPLWACTFSSAYSSAPFPTQ